MRAGRLAAAAAVAISAVGLVGCGTPDSEAQDGAIQDSAQAAAAVRVINVEVTPVVPGAFIDYIRMTGEAEALYDVTVAAEESGTIVAYAVEKGSQVNEGQVIARIDDAVLRSQVDEARAGARLAAEQYNRQRQLWEVDSLGSEIVYLQARYGSEMADARLALLETRLAKTVVRAPVSGVFDERYVEAGEIAAAGTPLVRIVSVARLKIAAGVPERHGPFVHTGDQARITFDVFPGREFFGRITYVGTSVDPGSRTFPIEVVMDNPDGLVKPHMLADVRVTREASTDVITVPQQVVLRTATGYKVFVVEERDGLSYSAVRPVVLGSNYDNQVVIREGLVPGDVLITLGSHLVDDGSRVNIVNQADAAPAGREGEAE